MPVKRKTTRIPLKIKTRKKGMHRKREIPAVLLQEKISNKIFLLRNEKIMLDKDLAKLYGVKPIRLREQVKRNLKKFPTNFMFVLNEPEVEIMVSQNAIPSKKHLGGSLPMAFTEHGILMLANILNSQKATMVSIKIIETFVKIRTMFQLDIEIKLEVERIKKKLENHEKNIEVAFRYLDELLEKKSKPRKRIGFTFPHSLLISKNRKTVM